MQYLAVILIACAGGIVQSITGFGCGIIMMLFLPYMFGMIPAAALSTGIGTVMTITVAIKFRKYAQYKKIILPAIFYCTCCTLAVKFVKGMDLTLLKGLFGGFLILLSIYMLFIVKNAKLKVSLPLLILFSIFSGTCGGLFSIGGPLMALYFLNETTSQFEYKGTLQSFFVLTSMTGTISRIMTGIYTSDLIIYTLIGMVGVLAGTKIGLYFSQKINAESAKKIIYIYVGISGIITVAQVLL